MSRPSVEHLAAAAQAQAHARPAPVLPFLVRRERTAPTATTVKQAREHEESRWLAMQVHLSDIRLGRCEDIPFHALTDDERAEKHCRALMWVRLGDQAVIDTSAEHAAQAVLEEHSLAIAFLPSAREMARTVTRIVLAHLQGRARA